VKRVATRASWLLLCWARRTLSSRRKSISIRHHKLFAEVSSAGFVILRNGNVNNNFRFSAPDCSPYLPSLVPPFRLPFGILSYVMVVVQPRLHSHLSNNPSAFFFFNFDPALIFIPRNFVFRIPSTLQCKLLVDAGSACSVTAEKKRRPSVFGRLSSKILYREVSRFRGSQSS